MVEGAVRHLLKAEGLALFVATLVAYAHLDGSWVLFVVLFFVPDLTFLAYLINTRAGAIAYNALHSTVGPLVLGLLAWQGNSQQAILVAIIWLAHVGFDRMLGYGLKYASGFKDTHLGKL